MKRENLKESTNKKKPKIKLTKLGNRVKNISLLVISLLLIGCVIIVLFIMMLMISIRRVMTLLNKYL